MDWVARCSAGNFAEFIGKRQSTDSRADTENDAGHSKSDDSFSYVWLLAGIVVLVPEESHE